MSQPKHEVDGYSVGSSGYRHGCRCDDCKASNRKYQRKHRANDETTVTNQPTITESISETVTTARVSVPSLDDDLAQIVQMLSERDYGAVVNGNWDTASETGKFIALLKHRRKSLPDLRWDRTDSLKIAVWLESPVTAKVVSDDGSADNEPILAEIVDESSTDTPWAKLRGIAIHGLGQLIDPGTRQHTHMIEISGPKTTTRWGKPTIARTDSAPRKPRTVTTTPIAPMLTQEYKVQFSIDNPNGIDCPVTIGRRRCGNGITRHHRIDNVDVCAACWQKIATTWPSRVQWLNVETGMWLLASSSRSLAKRNE